MTKVGQMIFADGFEQGIEQGIERGIEQGIERGIEQGIRAGIQAVIVTCKKLGGSKTDALSMIINQFSLASDMAQEFVEEFWERS